MLLSVIVTGLVSANLLGLYQAGIPLLGLTFVLGAIPYAISFSCFDIAMESLGPGAAARIRKACLCSYLFCFLICGLTFIAAEFSTEVEPWLPKHSKNYLALLAGSTFSFAASQEINAWVFFNLRARTGEKYLVARCLISTMVAQVIDTIVFVEIAWLAGFHPLQSVAVDKLLSLMGGQFVVKCLICVGSLVFVVPVIRWFRQSLVSLNESPGISSSSKN
jgi:queuosine precursor transporter